MNRINAKEDKHPSFNTSDLLNATHTHNFEIAHGFFSRAGGVSKGCYTSLNVGLGSDDKRDDVLQNRSLCEQALNSPDGGLLTLAQIHSNHVVVIDETTALPLDSSPEADALVTNQADIMLGVLAADCMPFLFVDPEAKTIGAAHAGWRGALAGVLENTLEAMIKLGSKPRDIHVCLGPCLRQKNFEVGLDLVTQFTDKYPETDQFFAPGLTLEKRQFDLAGFGFWRLKELGVEKVDDVNICTLAQPDDYFSYRYARKTNAIDYGRNLSAIMIKAA